MQVINYKTFNPSLLSLESKDNIPKIADRAGTKSASILYNGKPWVFQFTESRFPFGVKVAPNDKFKKGELDCNLAIELSDEDKVVLDAVDSFLIQQTIAYKLITDADEMLLRRLIKPLAKKSKDPKYPPLSQGKIPLTKEEKRPVIYTMDNEGAPIPPSSISQGSHGIAVCDIGRAWWQTNQFGVSNYAKQVKRTQTGDMTLSTPLFIDE
jgi:hypothetical protein